MFHDSVEYFKKRKEEVVGNLRRKGVIVLLRKVLNLFLDLILLGALIQEGLPAETAVGIALVNPLQAFRTSSMLLFDPQLVLLGPSAYIILDNFGEIGYLAWAMTYPILLGLGYGSER